jgi:hypothetical protein
MNKKNKIVRDISWATFILSAIVVVFILNEAGVSFWVGWPLLNVYAVSIYLIGKEA